MEEQLQEIIGMLDMQAWLDRECVDYKVTRGASGQQLNVRECPCCGNSNWKVYLNAKTGLGNCFHGDCEEKFNKWKFISKSLPNLSTREIIENIKQAAKEQGWKAPRKHSVAVDLNKLELPESYALPIDGRNLKYLDNRGISGDIARYFHLRICVNGGYSYREEGKLRFQDYSKRIIIPVFDLDGNLVSFQGRDITGEAAKKYLFPPGFAATGSHLYNGQNAIGAAHVVMGEGVFDVAATKIALDEEMALRDIVPIGSFGKHLSHGDDESQLAKLELLRELGLKMVTIMWDGEERAIQDAIEAGLLLRRHGYTARIAVLPKDKDPNEVPAAVVRQAFWRAEVVNQHVAARLKLARR